MGSVDWPLEKLVDYKPESTARDDFEAFWCGSLAESQQVPVNAAFEKVEDNLPGRTSTTSDSTAWTVCA